MPKIIIKRPFTEPAMIDSQSRTLYELENEYGYSLIPFKFDYSLMLLIQSNIEYDEPNLIFQNEGFSGTVFLVRVTKSKLIDVTMEDLEEFNKQIKPIRFYE